ncbi:MAG TPA: hypothetical protein VH253_07270 [Phycisphaerae bacterium]|nr:hypothetical protein [Phycisphaerae bacterium]
MKVQTLLAAGLMAAALAAIPGCETMQSKIPGTAQPVAMGTGNTMYQAGSDGTIYIYDKTWNKIVYTGQVQKGDNVVLDALADKVTIDGKTVVEQIPLGEGSQYEFFLDSSTPTARGEKVIEKQTVIERE